MGMYQGIRKDNVIKSEQLNPYLEGQKHYTNLSDYALWFINSQIRYFEASLFYSGTF